MSRREIGELKAENAALREQLAAVLGRCEELERRLGQNSSNSSRPPSSDPPQTPKRANRERSDRKAGGQPGPRAAIVRWSPIPTRRSSIRLSTAGAAARAWAMASRSASRSAIKHRCIWREEFETIDDARQVIDAYVDRYHHRPHSRLAYKTPREVAATWQDPHDHLTQAA